MNARAILHDALLPVPRRSRRHSAPQSSSNNVIEVRVLLSPDEASALVEGVWTNTAAWDCPRVNLGDAAMKSVREAARHAVDRNW